MPKKQEIIFKRPVKLSCHSAVHHKHYVVDILINVLNGLIKPVMLHLGRIHTKHLLLTTIPHLNSF